MDWFKILWYGMDKTCFLVGLYYFMYSFNIMILIYIYQQTKKSTRKALPPVKYLEGEVIWAKFNRRPWWPCQVTVHPVEDVYHRIKGKYTTTEALPNFSITFFQTIHPQKCVLSCFRATRQDQSSVFPQDIWGTWRTSMGSWAIYSYICGWVSI